MVVLKDLNLVTWQQRANETRVSMNTFYLLMAEFETVTPSLANVSEKYLGLKPSTAEKKALLGELALPTFRIGESQKAPRLVHLGDLAEHIDKARKEARELYDHINN